MKKEKKKKKQIFFVRLEIRKYISIIFCVKYDRSDMCFGG